MRRARTTSLTLAAAALACQTAVSYLLRLQGRAGPQRATGPPAPCAGAGARCPRLQYNGRMPKREPPFEESYRQLEEIVRKLEAGGLPLDECVALFEEAMRLARACNARLDAAELRITQITSGEGGEVGEVPFDPDAARSTGAGPAAAR